MKWINTKTSAANEHFELWNKGQKLLSLIYNTSLQTARIECADTKRMFMIEKEGFLRGRTVLKNEYGVKIGYLGLEKTHSPVEFIEIDNDRFYYTLRNNPLSELVIYKTTQDAPIVVCAVSSTTGNNDVRFEKGNDIHSTKNSCLLMALCWFLFMPVSKENVLEYA